MGHSQVMKIKIKSFENKANFCRRVMIIMSANLAVNQEICVCHTPEYFNDIILEISVINI